MERELYTMKNKLITTSLITILIIFNVFIAIKYYQNTKEYSKIKTPDVLKLILLHYMVIVKCFENFFVFWALLGGKYMYYC